MPDPRRQRQHRPPLPPQQAPSPVGAARPECSSSAQPVATGEDEGDGGRGEEGEVDGDFDGLGAGDFDGVGRTVDVGRTAAGIYVADGLTEGDGFAACDAEGPYVEAIVPAGLGVLLGSERTADRDARSGEGDGRRR